MQCADRAQRAGVHLGGSHAGVEEAALWIRMGCRSYRETKAVSRSELATALQKLSANTRANADTGAQSLQSSKPACGGGLH